MALTTLDPNTALLVVDLQKGIVGMAPAEAIGAVVERAKTLVDAFRAARLPIVLINVVGGAPGRTEQSRRLKAIGVTQVVVIGVATGTGVEATARQAYEAGFNVSLAIDAMTDPRSEAHAYSIGQVFPRLGETGTSQEIIELLSKRSA